MPRCLEPPTARLEAHGKEGRIRMIRWIAAAGFVVAVATSAQAITPAPIPQSDGMITQVRFGCAPGRTLVAGPLRGHNHHPSYPPSHPQELLRAHPPAAANCAIK